MIAAPAPPDRAAKATGSMEDFVPCLSPRRCLRPWPRVLAGRDDGAGAARGDGSMAAPRVVGPISTDLVDGLVGRDLVKQFGQHRGIANPAACHFDCPDFQRIRIDAQMDFAPLPRFGRPVFLGKPLAFALGLDPSAVDQKMQCARTGTIGNGDVQTFLAA